MSLPSIKEIFSKSFWVKNSAKKPSKYGVKIERHSNYLMVSTSQIIRIWVLSKLLGKSTKDFKLALTELDDVKREKAKSKSLDTNPTPEAIKVYFMAIVLDGEVVDVLRASQKLADILLARPEFIAFSPSESPVEVGMGYSDGVFVHKEHNHG